MTRPGDKQPPWREELVAHARLALSTAQRVAREFDQAMEKYRGAETATPEQISHLESQLEALAKRS